LTAQPVIGVLALQGDVREHAAALTDCGAQARPVRRVEELDGLQGIVLPGGESTTMSRLLETFELLEPLKARIAGGLPAYGSCAGMIMLAIVRRNAFGRQVDSFEGNLEFTGIGGGPLHAVFIRAPWVESVSPEVEVLATVPDLETAGAAAGRIVAVRQRSVLATAFHPELTGDGRVHRLFTEMVRAS
jgi:pyridoxal 5'-phosphate synthase pdxT subunit